jgi:eukaryotic-like serine/threonine-protein kinase
MQPADTDAGLGYGDIRPGCLLRDSYRVEHLVASGGIGRVFAARHLRLPGRFAVKALNGDRVLDPESLARFRAEARITASLRHPHVVQLYDFDVSPEGVPYLVMEFLEGGDLRTLAAGGPLAIERVARIVRHVASALQAAHAAGIVHRDLKPENVMLIELAGEKDFVKVVDFGLSKLVSACGPPVTKPHQVVGTPGYMAPEQVVGRGIDHRADQFALACLAYELLAARAPFVSHEPAELLDEVLHREPPELAALVRWPATHVSRVLARGLAKAAADRYRNVTAFDQAFRAAAELDAQQTTASARAAAVWR